MTASDNGSKADLPTALREAMTRRVAQVQTEPTPAARAAVDHRISRRARARQTRRGTLAAALVVAVVASGVTLARWNGRGDGAGPDVSTQGVDRPELRMGRSSDDPADLGMPRLTIDGLPSLDPDVGPAPLVTTTAAGPSSSGITQAQLFHPEDALLPLIVAPWNPSGAAAPLPQPTAADEVVDVSGASATLQGDPRERAVLSWPMADGTKAYLHVFGATQDQLLTVARSLRHRAGEAGYVVEDGALPEGFVERRLTAPAEDEPMAAYSVGLRGDGDRRVTLAVGRGGDERWVEGILAAPGGAGTSVERGEVLGRPAVVVDNGETGGWMVFWSPEPGIGAILSVDGAGVTRADVDAAIAAVHELDRQAWREALAEGREP